MKIIKRLFLSIIAIIALLVAGLYITGHGYIVRGATVTYLNGHTTAFLDDYNYFDNDTLTVGEAQPWSLALDYNKVTATKRLDSLNQANRSAAYLIIKNDSIWYEWYNDGYDHKTLTNSFSMAKSIVTAALGKAIMQGKIKSLDTRVGDYINEFSSGAAADMTVGDLASMASGLDWDEKYYSPFSKTTQLYFDTELATFMKSIPVVEKPGTRYEYSSGATQLLAMTIEKAVGEKLASYVARNFWKPLGAENDALWQTDPNGLAKAYCCIASNARDFARFGKLYKQSGRWNGDQILDSAFVKKSVTPRFQETPFYGYGWWLTEYEGKEVFYMRGHLGQYVIVIPQDDLIVVRLGHLGNVSPEGQFHSRDFRIYIEEAQKMLGTR